MKNKLRKLIPFIFLAVITMAVVVPSAAFVAPRIVHAQAAPAPAATPPATPAPAATPPPKAAPTGETAEASLLGNIVVKGVSYIVEMLISLFGKLTVQLIHILIVVAGYNSYMTAPAITTGWVIVRDLANLFFVALILIVSIGSIVNPDRFKGPQQVFRILLFALLVNFSRTIAGLFIDISQLVMLTFVNGFAQAAGGNFVEALGVTKLTDFPQTGGAIGTAETIAALFLALLMFVIITVIIGVMVVALVVRMVTLWLLVVVSPLAFALGASDSTKQHYNEWWKKFSAELTTGPIVAFFLWLSLVSFQQSTNGTELTGQTLKPAANGAEAVSINCAATTACTEENMIRFIVATVMLLVGLGFAKEFSGLGGSLASSAISKGKGYANSALKYGQTKAWNATKAVGGVAAAPVTIPLSKVGDQYNRLKAGTGRFLGKASTSQNWAVRNIVGTFTRPASIALTSSAGKRDAEKDKKAREELQHASPEALSGIITSIFSTDAEKRAASMKILKDKSFIRSRSDSADAEERARAKMFGNAVDHLRSIKPGLDKEVDDVVKDGKEKRPDAFVDPATHAIDLLKSSETMTRDDFLKLDLGGITDADLTLLTSRIPSDVMVKIIEKANAKTRERLDNIILPRGADAGQVHAALTNGINMQGVSVINPPPPVPAGAPPPIPPPPPTVNMNIALETLLHGTQEQVRQLSRNTEALRVATAHRDQVRDHSDLNQHGPAGGFDPTDSRLDDDNLRHAEAAMIVAMNQDGPVKADMLRTTYRADRDGNFNEARMMNSFVHSLQSSPQKINLIMSLPQNALVSTPGGNDVTHAVSDTLNPADLNEIAARSTTPADASRLTNLIHAIDSIVNDATQNMARRNHAQSLMQHVANDQDLVTFV